jgi:hypothetical protein
VIGARVAFRRAGLVDAAEIARAYDLRQRAQLFYANSSENTDSIRKDLYIEAGDAFLACAGRATEEQAQHTNYVISAECYAEADLHERSARLYLRASKFTQSAHQFRLAGLFNEAVHIVVDNRSQVDEEYATKLLDVAKIHYLRHNVSDHSNVILLIAQLFALSRKPSE